MIFDLEKDIVNSTKYVSGYKNDEDKYTISASMVANEPLQNYLSIIHGKINGDTIDDTHLGSVFHRGMETIMQERGEEGTSPVWATEYSMYVTLSNDWILSGTADLILEPTPGNFEIRDYKLTKSYAHKMFLKEKYSHSYTKQLQVLEALFREGENRPEVIENITLVCDYFLKDAKAIEYEASFRPEVIPDKAGTEDIRASEVTLMEVVEITNVLQAYIEAGEIPPICKDRWPRNIKGQIIPTRCALYCGYKNVCPHYNPDTRQEVSRLVNW